MAPDATPALLDPMRLLFDIQRVNGIIQNLSGCLEAQTVAHRTAAGLVEQFGCAFARIWLMEADAVTLRLIASAGMYTRTDGSFARVAMGAYKIGKIAQNRIPFLSNNLSEESWVRDREWAIQTGIRGFAGYPLMNGERVLGVLAAFHRQPMTPEFLEALQWLCTSVVVVMENALLFEQNRSSWHAQNMPVSLSEQLAQLLAPARFMLVGTERLLSASTSSILLKTTRTLTDLGCTYGRLTYLAEGVSLEAVIPQTQARRDAFDPLTQELLRLGGTLQMQQSGDGEALQVLVQLPYRHSDLPEEHPNLLSVRELEILTLLAAGLRDREIADHLHISERTVKFHTNNALNKLKARTRTQAVYRATLYGWVTTEPLRDYRNGHD
ncbi:LuxR C-terminal-related transcriptional regulator [Anthocerotibacter panamensis]|uniref:LuxR C-terminal-related transcriptional regulator n=1 Tax=Anthocerotibacter panamensis TaxID=2857077 RepID=UPI0024798DC0|nr:LuxR C-terminal-related transcriptional regulator [Anthocerotibacter panamensis]